MASPHTLMVAAVAAFALSSTGFAAAQTSGGHAYPSIGGEKVRGLEEMNNSGQIGTATLTQQPNATTHVILTVKGAPAGKTEAAALYRSNDSTCHNLHAKADFELAPVTDGKSSTIVKVDRERLLSGNYFIVVGGSSKPMACGHLVNE